ncbi:MAG: amidohydrolase, partial [Armatimonadetes bacterium]|nr:amidohydrolase [Armatimonadota bacterium]
TNKKIDYLIIKDKYILDYGVNFKGSFKGKIFDLKGLTLIPGFIDAHTHFLQTGLNFKALDLYDCKSLNKVLEKLSSHLPKSGWLYAKGLDESNFKERKLPTCFNLDKISKKIKIFISRIDYHTSIVNSLVLKSFKIPSKFLNLKESKLGIFRAEANNWIRRKVFNNLSLREKLKALKEAEKLALSQGVTTAHILEGGELFGSWEFILENLKLFKIKMILYPQITQVNLVKRLGLPRIGGCILADGSFGSRSAAISSSYQDDPGNFGRLYFKDEELYNFVKRAHQADLQVSLHAIGDRAINQVVKIYEKVQNEIPKDLRHRIEHCELPKNEDIKKIKENNIYLSVQPAFEHFWGGIGKMYNIRLGERYLKTNQFKNFINNNIPLAGGSDSDVTPINPILGIIAAVNHPNFKERVSIRQALNMFTKESAKFSFEENIKGKLEKGYSADLTALNYNPLKLHPGVLNKLKVVMTIVGGEVVEDKSLGKIK